MITKFINKTMRKTLLLTTLLLLSIFSIKAQDDLLDILNDEQAPETNYALATFKGARLINGHTIITRKAKELEFIISHRFGRINTGIDEFFGLDGANVRFSLEYGITDDLTGGIVNKSFEKGYDGFM